MEVVEVEGDGEEQKGDKEKAEDEVPEKEKRDVQRLQAQIGRCQKGWLSWLKSLDYESLGCLANEIVRMGGSTGEECASYLRYVQANQTLGVCAKCEWKWGCERCEYMHALRYVVRWEKPSAWWFRLEGRAANRFTKGSGWSAAFSASPGA